MALDVDLAALAQVLLDQVGRLAGLAAVERFDVKEDGLVFPLPGLLVLAAGC